MDRLIRSIDSMVESGELAAARRDEREPAIRQPVVSTPVVPDAPAPAEPKAEARATAATEPPLYRVPPPIVTPAAVTTEQIPHEPAVSFRPVRMMSDPEPEAPQRQDRSGIPSRPLLSRFPPRYMAAAAAAAIAIIFLGYQAVSYLNRESTKLASAAEPRVVASDNRAATAARPQVDAAIPVKPPVYRSGGSGGPAVARAGDRATAETSGCRNADHHGRWRRLRRQAECAGLRRAGCKKLQRRRRWAGLIRLSASGPTLPTQTKSAPSPSLRTADRSLRRATTE